MKQFSHQWTKVALSVALTALMAVPMLMTEAQAHDRRDRGCRVNYGQQRYNSYRLNQKQRRKLAQQQARRYRQIQRAAYQNPGYGYNYGPVGYGYGYRQPTVLGQILSQL